MSSFLLILNMPLLLFITFIVSAPSSFFILVNAYSFPSYEQCAPYTCGNSTIQYPFGTCGPLNASCQRNKTIQIHLLGMDGRVFNGRVVGGITEYADSSGNLQIAQDDIGNPSVTYDWITGKSAFFNFSLSPGFTVGRIVNCTEHLDCGGNNSQCFFYSETDLQSCGGNNSHYFFHSETDLQSCTSYPIIVPNKNCSIKADPNFELLKQKGFKISWSISEDCHSCQGSGGYCFYNYNYLGACICPKDGAHLWNCNDGFVLPSDDNYGFKGVSGAISVLLILLNCVTLAVYGIVVVSFCCIIVRCYRSRKKTTGRDDEDNILVFMNPLHPGRPTLKKFLKFYKSQMPKRYSYSQIRSYTKYFAEKVGKGGFGTVYKGKLPSGSLIAVKMLDKSKQSEHQFIAEVATVGMTYHVNLVRLLGYCSKGSKRALVYEYMVNGSLDKYIHGDHQDQLDWKQLHSIAVGTARGIAYLHEDCRNRILHCDIKPHNVLVDVDFFPKVGDFGLAKISDKNDTHISAAHGGTIGYAAPEMWSRMYGPVTDRSDVYSYGMLLMEMVGGRRNFDNKQSRSSKSYYPEWVFNQVEKGEFGKLRKGNMSEEDQGIAKKLSLVGLWCIQFTASRRPPMSKVIQMLEGSIDITTPPFPFPVTPPFPFPVDTLLQLSLIDQSSSTHASEIQMVNPTATMQTVKSSRYDDILHSIVKMAIVHSSGQSSVCWTINALENDIL